MSVDKSVDCGYNTEK
ncbi:Hypothetical small peptide [Latilactobacillus sakei subsp. sakei 23K]|uniref:Hypothetical small peptide n=1 Tax=Latilactobacillus sakei subsp. sakei (strain 23K) TaxID=314315 RepID=Q38ZJ5_LATSS|nr:Hypothetical small peptide [Latilactobacillus sakei subsp. sakei 23K]